MKETEKNYTMISSYELITSRVSDKSNIKKLVQGPHGGTVAQLLPGMYQDLI